ncbi:hypothetical protein [Massilia sp. CFBP9026]|uniref:hypothetical protein n=1 Tax=Massilia sp. CFBP9026 TaxID=3096536 RepID=UPI002A69E6B4|nr:hypothetical protein [Massilia sp. CFBP9026]MDY0961724.1 hypothetical protein [Massilia sp. CFBP9026]
MPQIVLAFLVFIGIFVVVTIRDIASWFGAGPWETGALVFWGFIGLCAVLVAAFNRVLSLRTGFLAYLTLLIPTIRSFLATIANNGMSPDDPMLWRAQIPWYSSWTFWAVVGVALVAATVWSWKSERNWYY